MWSFEGKKVNRTLEKTDLYSNSYLIVPIKVMIKKNVAYRIRQSAATEMDVKLFSSLACNPH